MVGVFGARGAGKNYWITTRPAILKARRLLVWDHKGDPHPAMAAIGKRYDGQAGLAQLIRDMRAPTFRIRFVPDHAADIDAQFALFCQAAFLVGNLVLWVDELPEVTKANRAPPAWKKCVNVGREYTGHDGKRRELTIYGSGQRPGEVDKSFMNNLDLLHTGRIANGSDARILADFIRVDYRELMDLPDLHWIERRAGQTEQTRGVMPTPRPVVKNKSRAGRGALEAPP